MGRKLIATLGALVLVALALVVLPSGSSAGGRGNCIIPETNGITELQNGSGELAFCQALDITKEVIGDAAGRTFPITVECEQVVLTGGTEIDPGLPDADLFPPYEPKVILLRDGETQRILVAREADCEISEAPPEGCTLVSIDPEEVQTRNPRGNNQGVDKERPPLIVHTVTVVNDCPAAAPAAAAADAIAAQPTFTG